MTVDSLTDSEVLGEAAYIVQGALYNHKIESPLHEPDFERECEMKATAYFEGAAVIRALHESGYRIAPAESAVDEEWRAVLGWEGFYEVSSVGRVRSLDRTVETSNSQRTYKGKLLAQHTDGEGRKVLSLFRPGTSSRRYVSNLVAEAFIGPRPPGLRVLHWDDNSENNTVSNLRWGTPSDNMYDRVRNGNNHHAEKTHCIRGHALTGPNLYRREGRPQRQCRACKSANSAVRDGRIQKSEIQTYSDAKYAQLQGDSK